MHFDQPNISPDDPTVLLTRSDNQVKGQEK